VKLFTRSAAALGVVAAASLAIAGCASAPTATTHAPINYKACMVSDSGGFKDASFNEEAYNGLLNAQKDLGVQVGTVESPNNATQTDYVSGVKAMVDAKCNLIVNVGFNLAVATRDSAKANTSVNYALIDSALSNDDYSLSACQT